MRTVVTLIVEGGRFLATVDVRCSPQKGDIVTMNGPDIPSRWRVCEVDGDTITVDPVDDVARFILAHSAAAAP